MRIHARSSRDERAREGAQRPAVVVVLSPLVGGDDDDDNEADKDVSEESPDVDTTLVRLATSPRKARSMAGSGWVFGIRPSISAMR